MYPDLRDRWYKTMNLVGVPAAGPADGTYNDILLAYSEPHRRYHGVEHLRSCFRVLDTYFFDASIHGAIEIALWFHDFIYDTHALDNEERSAMEALDAVERLGLQSAFSRDVRDLILATKHVPSSAVGLNSVHDVQLARARHVMLDVDLSILGEPSEVFDAYEHHIREEYSWVPDLTFREGRTRIIREFLERPSIFHHRVLHDAGYEDRARSNLQRSYDALGRAETTKGIIL